MMVRLQFQYSEEYEVPLHCHYSQVHSLKKMYFLDYKYWIPSTEGQNSDNDFDSPNNSLYFKTERLMNTERLTSLCE